MGFTINETIITQLSYKDVALIAVAMGEYQRLYKNTANKDVLKQMEDLVNRLGIELYDYPNNNHSTLQAIETYTEQQVKLKKKRLKKQNATKSCSNCEQGKWQEFHQYPCNECVDYSHHEKRK